MTCDDAEPDTGESLEMREGSGLWFPSVWEEKVLSYGTDVAVKCSLCQPLRGCRGSLYPPSMKYTL